MYEMFYLVILEGKTQFIFRLIMQYAVVECVNEVEGQALVQELQLHWLLNNNSRCWWPSSNANRHVAKGLQPETNWVAYPIELRKIYGNCVPL